MSVGNSPTVNVGNSPAVGAQQSGVWNVGITGTPTMGIDPSANTVNDVADHERQAVQVMGGVFLPDGTQTNTSSLYFVPANKRFVVTDVSFRVNLPSGQQLLRLSIYLSSGAEQSFAPTLIGTDVSTSTDSYQGNYQTTFVVKAGQTLQTFLERNQYTGSAVDAVTVTGYLIDCTTALPCN